MTLRSPAFQDEGPLPATAALERGNLSPALRWRSVPSTGPFLVLLCLGITQGTPVVHWLEFDILSFASSGYKTGEVPLWSSKGLNAQGGTGYFGPSDQTPVMLEFHLFALSQAIGDGSPLDWSEVRARMAGLVVRGPAVLRAHYPVAP